MITSIQGHSLSMAGLLANVSTLRVTEGGTQNAWWNFWNRNSDSFNTCSKNFCESIKKWLDVLRHPGLWLLCTSKIWCRDWRPDNLYSADTH